MALWKGYVGVLRRDLLGWRRRPFEWLLPLFFFGLVCVVFAIAAGANAAFLAAAAPAVVWSAALLAALMTHEGVFLPDFESGFVEMALASPLPLPLFALAKASAHWVGTGVPLTAAAPVAAAMLGMPAAGVGALAMTLPPAMAALSLLTAFVAALTAGRRNALLAALLALPLAVPLLIFAVAAVELAAGGQSPAAAAALLAALALLALTFLPLAIAGALRATGGR